MADKKKKKIHKPKLLLQEDVSPNLIPMIDIMFLLLLFFMLGADMGQRELAEVVLPDADKAKEEKKEIPPEGRVTVNVYHRPVTSLYPCPDYDAKGRVCRNHDHWLIGIKGKEYTTATLKKPLDDFANQKREATPPAPGMKPLSQSFVMVRADNKAPFGFVQRVIEACAAAGLYKIEVGAAKPPAPKS